MEEIKRIRMLQANDMCSLPAMVNYDQRPAAAASNVASNQPASATSSVASNQPQPSTSALPERMDVDQ